MKNTDHLCRKCYSKLKSNFIPNTAYSYNNLDPGPIPPELQILWVIEKRLMAIIQIFLTLLALPGDQLAEKGRAIHIPVQTQSLPCQPEDNNIVILSCERPQLPPVDISYRHDKPVHYSG